jgi:hypothetical protein
MNAHQFLDYTNETLMSDYTRERVSKAKAQGLKEVSISANEFTLNDRKILTDMGYEIELIGTKAVVQL